MCQDVACLPGQCFDDKFSTFWIVRLRQFDIALNLFVRAKRAALEQSNLDQERCISHHTFRLFGKRFAQILHVWQKRRNTNRRVCHTLVAAAGAHRQRFGKPSKVTAVAHPCFVAR